MVTDKRDRQNDKPSTPSLRMRAEVHENLYRAIIQYYSPDTIL